MLLPVASIAVRCALDLQAGDVKRDVLKSRWNPLSS